MAFAEALAFKRFIADGLLPFMIWPKLPGGSAYLIRSPHAYVPLIALLLAVFWTPSLQVPFWQDDYHFLMVAKAAREAGESWFSVFWPSEKSIFWRPLSEGLYWRLIEGPLDADPVAAHAVNLVFLIGAALAVAWLVTEFAQLVHSPLDRHKAFVIAALLYGIHAAHFLPAVWATAVHTSMVVLFSALALRFWVAALREGAVGSWVGLLSIPVFLLLALFSKENAILVIPLGGLLTVLSWKETRPTRSAMIIAAFSVLLALVWLRLRHEMVVPPSGAYELGAGINTLRNVTSMVLFALNVPRESLRFVLEQHSAVALLWALTCASLYAAALWLVIASTRSRFGPKGALAAITFFLIAAAPHLLFSWNAYAYYITLGLIVWPFLAAYACLSSRRASMVFGAALLSSLISVGGNYALDYPSLLGRARWADQQLKVIRGQFPPIAEQARIEGIVVEAENRHKFLSIGIDGLAFALDLPSGYIQDVAPGEQATEAAVTLVVPDQHNAFFTQ